MQRSYEFAEEVKVRKDTGASVVDLTRDNNKYKRRGRERLNYAAQRVSRLWTTFAELL